MATARTFGRRNASPPTLAHTAPQAYRPEAETLTVPTDWSSADAELDDWKRARKPVAFPFALPWRQVFLMAGLCFGVASFVLPDTVNDAVDWLLYALAAMSFYAGLRRKRG